MRDCEANASQCKPMHIIMKSQDIHPTHNKNKQDRHRSKKENTYSPSLFHINLCMPIIRFHRTLACFNLCNYVL